MRNKISKIDKFNRLVNSSSRSCKETILNLTRLTLKFIKTNRRVIELETIEDGIYSLKITNQGGVRGGGRGASMGASGEGGGVEGEGGFGEDEGGFGEDEGEAAVEGEASVEVEAEASGEGAGADIAAAGEDVGEGDGRVPRGVSGQGLKGCRGMEFLCIAFLLRISAEEHGDTLKFPSKLSILILLHLKRMMKNMSLVRLPVKARLPVRVTVRLQVRVRLPVRLSRLLLWLRRLRRLLLWLRRMRRLLLWLSLPVRVLVLILLLLVRMWVKVMEGCQRVVSGQGLKGCRGIEFFCIAFLLRICAEEQL